MADHQTYTIESPDGETATFDLPEGLVETVAEPGETEADTVADVAFQTFVQQAHALVHHSDGEVPPDLEAMNEAAEALFEERYGQSLSEAMGHEH